ncbi:MAG: hypothetical protein ACOYNN_08630 [Terrimicrobiaceae bacterium]
MDATYKQFVESGKVLISDTKQLKKVAVKQQKPMKEEDAGDPHKVFIRNTIGSLPSKADLLVEVKKFITAAEERL